MSPNTTASPMTQPGVTRGASYGRTVLDGAAPRRQYRAVERHGTGQNRSPRRRSSLSRTSCLSAALPTPDEVYIDGKGRAVVRAWPSCTVRWCQLDENSRKGGTGERGMSVANPPDTSLMCLSRGP